MSKDKNLQDSSKTIDDKVPAPAYVPPSERVFMHDQFYVTSHLEVYDKVALMNDAKAKCYEWWVDELNCGISIARRKIDMSYEDVLKLFNNGCHFTFIHRKGYNNPFHLEIGFTTMNLIAHYLWIKVDQKELDFFTKKYKLKPFS